MKTCQRALIMLAVILVFTACAPIATPVPVALPSEEPTLTPSLVATVAITPTSQPDIGRLLAEATTVTPLPSPTKSPQVLTPKKTAFGLFLEPWLKEALKRREERRNDPSYQHRIDPALNEGRVNFLFFGWGWDLQPSGKVPEDRSLFEVGSVSIVSYKLASNEVSLISITHDTWAPEVRRKVGPGNVKGISPNITQRIGAAYFDVSLDYLREVVEDATGLSVDFTFIFNDALIKRYIDEVLKGAEVEIPQDFVTYPFYMTEVKNPPMVAAKGSRYYLENVRYPKVGDYLSFHKGRQVLDGTMAVGYMKAGAVPRFPGEYNKSLENNRRKEVMLSALVDTAKIRAQSKEFWLDSATFFGREWANLRLSGTGSLFVRNEIFMDMDFVPEALFVSNAVNVVSHLDELRGSETGIPSLGQKLYVVDLNSGDGGVCWWQPTYDMEIPCSPGFTPNADGDLVTGYWKPVRDLVRNRLTSTPK